MEVVVAFMAQGEVLMDGRSPGRGSKQATVIKMSNNTVVKGLDVEFLKA